MNKIKSLLLQAKSLADKGRYKHEWYLQDCINEALSYFDDSGPENSREEMHPPTNGTLDCMGVRLVTA